jgi:hypothetical protein
MTVAATAQKNPKKGRTKPAPTAAKGPAEAAPPPASTTPEKEEEGPFAPKGRTGKLREDATPEEEDKAKSEKPAPPPPPAPPGMAGLDIVFGFGSTGGTTGPDAVDLSVASFVLGGAYQITPEWGARLRVPFATGKITHIGNESTTFEVLGEGYNAAAFGNIELAANYTYALGAPTKLPLEIALALPTANGDRFPSPDDTPSGRHYRINAAAAASRGLEEDALFSPHRFGIVPKASIQYRSGPIDADGFVKVPVLLKAGGQAVPPQVTGQASFALNSNVIEGVFGAGFHYGFIGNKIDLGVNAWATVMSAEFYDVIYNGGGVTGPSKFQFVMEPQIRANVASVRATLGFIAPLGGRLATDQQVNGVRVMGAYVF